MAKNLITTSITIQGIGAPDFKTIFNSENRLIERYRDISKYGNRYVTIRYSYDFEGVVKEDGRLNITLPLGLTEIELKEYIINEINSIL